MHCCSLESKIEQFLNIGGLACLAAMSALPARVLAQEAAARADPSAHEGATSQAGTSSKSIRMAAAAPAPASMPGPFEAAADPPPYQPPPTQQKRKEIEGHIGVAVLLVMIAHPTTTFVKKFNLAAPIGMGIKLNESLVFDFETIVITHLNQRDNPTSFTVDPGLVCDFGPFSAGLRLKWDVGEPPNIGAIPLVHRALVDLKGAVWFVEADFPITYVKEKVSFNIVLHTGIGF